MKTENLTTNRKSVIASIERLERTLHSLKGNVKNAAPHQLDPETAADLKALLFNAQSEAANWNGCIARGEI